MKGGLVNRSNTCYLNSAIQALRFLSPLSSFLIADERKIIHLLQKNIIKIGKNSVLLNTMNNHPIILEIKRKFKTNDYISLTDDEKIFIINNTITFQLMMLFKKINDEKIVNPENFKNLFFLIKNNLFVSASQHDAEEAYSCIIQQIHEEIGEKRSVLITKPDFNNLDYLRDKIYTKIYHNVGYLPDEIKTYETIKYKIDNKEFINSSYDFMIKYYSDNYSKITKLFTGFLTSSVSCPNDQCNFISRKIDLFLHLQLPILDNSTMHINDCFNEYFKSETLDKDNLWFCSKCNHNVSAIKKLNLWSMPKILVVQLKRFNTPSLKNNNTVVYPLEDLDISNWMDPLNKESITYPTYKLYTIINHIGNQDGGHYFTYCRNEIENIWVEYDDVNIKELVPHTLISPNAYMLFYIRK